MASFVEEKLSGNLPLRCVMDLRNPHFAAGMHAVILPNNNVIIHRFLPVEHDPDLQKAYDINEFRCQNMFNCYTRKLVNECHAIFMSAVRLPKDVDDNTRNQNIKKLSRRYHSVLLACMEDLEDASEAEKGSGEGTVNEVILNQKIMFSEIELIWSLIEVLLFNMQSRTLIVYRLLQWIQWHFTEPEKKAQEILEAEEPCEHPSYWDTIMQYVLQGNVPGARSLLKIHRLKNREDFLSMDELLRKMPMYFSNAGMSWTEFQMRWRHWQEECKRRLAAAEFSAVEELQILCKVLCGHSETLTEKSYLCSTWYHLLISVLLYTDPCISTNALGHLAKSYSSNITDGSELSNVDKMILAVMELDIVPLMNICLDFQDCGWFVAHMTDLLYRGNYISTSTVSNLTAWREYFFLDYAGCLMRHDSLWSIAADYYDQCDELGKEHLEMRLERIHFDSELKARKIIYVAKKRELDHLVRSVCTVMAMNSIRSKMFGTALSWVLQSKDVKLATFLANRWINEYSETGNFQCFDILKNLGPRMLVSDKLTFLGKYCEFHKLYEDRDFRTAAALLVSLLSSGLVPKTFQIVLLLDALPMLERDEPVFSMKETTELMACIERLSLCDSKEEQKPNLLKKERLIRLALSRNLARAFIFENSAA